MARAMARGWGTPVLCTDGGSGRAATLVEELGGEVLDSNARLAERVDLLVLCHKPAQLEAVAREVGIVPRAVASVLGGISLANLRAAYPGVAVFRLMPNTPVAVRRGVVCHAHDPEADPALERAVLDLFGQLGTVVTLEEGLVNVATAVMGVGPAYVALVVEAQVDAAVRGGLSAPRAAALVTETLAGTAALLETRGGDTLAVRREVTSPGGSTARGLAELERAGLRAAFDAALQAVVSGERG